MEWTAKATACFQKLTEDAPACHCSVHPHAGGVLVDAGWEMPGGWMAAKYVLEGLTGGRGQVSYAHRRMEDGAQLPAVELFLDDPRRTAEMFRADEAGVYGVRGPEGYCLGVTERPLEEAERQSGNLVAAGPNSLFSGVLRAGALLARGVEALEAEGIGEILWGWSSCPLAAMTAEAAETERRQAEMARHAAAVSLWVRGEGAAIRRAVERADVDGFCVHELVTAFTYQK